jgi:hypothetical protein
MINKNTTNGSRGIGTAQHFCNALIFVVTVLCGELVIVLLTP